MEAEKLDHNWNDRSVASNTVNNTSTTTTTTTTSSSSPLNSTISINNLTESQSNQRLIKTNDEFNKTDKNSNLVNKGPEGLISGSSVYSMQSKPRGFCIIINNVDFDDNRFPKRVGSDEECVRLSNIFTQL